MAYVQDLAPEQLLEEAYKTLVKDRARYAGTSYPQYKGQTISPMSSLTQRSRELGDQFSKTPAPYTRRIASVMGRENKGLTPENIEALLGNLRDGQRRLEDRSLSGVSKQFKSSETSYAPREERFRRKGGEDLARGLAESRGKLQELGKGFGNIEGERSRQTAQALQDLQANKQARRKALVGTLDEFGRQKHGYNNLVSTAQRNQFDQESRAPQTRMEMLASALEGAGSSFGASSHPDLDKSKGQEILKALRAYGIDTSKPTEEWESSRTAPSVYKGQLVAGLTPEILASHNIVERMDPALKDSFSSQRKQLKGDLLGTENITSRTLQALPESMRGEVDQLDFQAKQRQRKDLAEINNRYIKLGQFGSTQHRRDAEERARELNRTALEQRDKILRSSLVGQFSGQHGEEINKLKKLSLLGDQGQREYVDLLQEVRAKNKLGTTKWGNEQAENEELYKNYQNEALWEWPHMKGEIRREARQGALGDVFRGMEDRNISLDQLAALNTSYSETQRDRDRLRSDLLTTQASRNALEGELGRFRAEQAAKAAAERAAAERAASDRAAAAAAAERQRLAALKPVSTGRGWWELSPQDPYREEAIQWRRRYPGIVAYNADWRREHGVPEHLINHPFNLH